MGGSLRWLVAAGVASALLVVACGGDTSGAGGDGGAGSSSGNASGSGGGSGAGSSGTGGNGSSGAGSSGLGSSSGTTAGGCPESVPSGGVPCSPVGLVCEWGSSNVEECDTVGTCMPEGWDSPAYPPEGPDCSGGPPIACPSSYAAVPTGQACGPSGGYCDYPEGRCGCGEPPGPILLVDGSVASIWICQHPQTGCPQPRPRIGTTCSHEGQFCDYGGCGAVPGGNAEACTGGVWVDALEGCPL